MTCQCEGCVLRNYAECPRVSDEHRIAALEGQLREREAEVTAMKFENELARQKVTIRVAADLKTRLESAEAALAAARAENERLIGRTVESFVLARLETEMIGPSLSPDLCEQAMRIIAELRRVRRDLGGGNPLAALRARPDDAGRVERVAKALEAVFKESHLMFADGDDGVVSAAIARRVLAAADGEVKP